MLCTLVAARCSLLPCTSSRAVLPRRIDCSLVAACCCCCCSRRAGMPRRAALPRCIDCTRAAALCSDSGGTDDLGGGCDFALVRCRFSSSDLGKASPSGSTCSGSSIPCDVNAEIIFCLCAGVTCEYFPSVVRNHSLPSSADISARAFDDRAAVTSTGSSQVVSFVSQL